MAEYVLVGSHDPFESADGRRCYELAGDLAAGDTVTVYLVQNGVLPCRSTSIGAKTISGLAKHATVVADDFSLRERAIAVDELARGVRVAGIDALVDAVMADGRKVVWF